MLSVVRPADRSCSRDCDPGGMNELIFKPDKWAARMPHTIRAMFYKPDASNADQALDSVAEMRRKFVNEYGLREADCPLLRYDQRDRLTPWSDA